MSPFPWVETLGALAAVVAGVIGWRKSRRESATIADANARRLREDVTLLDKMVRKLRVTIHKLESWIVGHMWSEHGQRFDPSSVYDPEEEVVEDAD